MIPAAITTSAAISVVPSTSWRLAATYAPAVMAAAAPRSTIAGAVSPIVHIDPLRPANPPSIVKVRIPAKRAPGPSACPDR